MNKIDVIIAIAAIVGAVVGYQRGFIVSLLGLVAFTLGTYGGIILMKYGKLFFYQHFHWNSDIIPLVSFLVIFILIVVAVTLLARFLKKSIRKTLLGSIDEIAGAMLGVFKSLFFLSVLFWIADSLKIVELHVFVEGSRFYPFTATIAPTLGTWAGYWIAPLHDIFG